MKTEENKHSALEVFIPLDVIALEGGHFRGRTRLQKLVFLIQKKLKDPIYYEFEKAQWGPLSYQLYSCINRLISINMVKETTKSTPSGNTVVCYELTEEGKTFLDYLLKKKMVPISIRRTVKKVYIDYGSLSIVDLLKKVHKEYPEFVENSENLPFSIT